LSAKRVNWNAKPPHVHEETRHILGQKYSRSATLTSTLDPPSSTGKSTKLGTGGQTIPSLSHRKEGKLESYLGGMSGLKQKTEE